MTKDKSFLVAEEIFVTVRELTRPGRWFLWRTWVRAHDAIYGKHWMGRGDTRHLHMSSGQMLRAQIKHGTIKKIRRGLYSFIKDMPKRPLYDYTGMVSPHKFNPFGRAHKGLTTFLSAEDAEKLRKATENILQSPHWKGF